MAFVLVFAGWATLKAKGPTPTPTASASGLSAASTPTPTPASTPTAGPTPTPTVSPPPATPTPEPSLPLVDSCVPASVPDANPVPPSNAHTGAFALHVPVLEYHRIVAPAQAGPSVGGTIVSPQLFSAQLDALHRAGWHTITLATLANDLAAQVKTAKKTLVITIDDGWDDGFTNALPILIRHGYVATYFVIAGRIDRPGFLTRIHLQSLVAEGDEIGDHTMDHQYLTRQSGAKLTYEIDAAAARIAQVTGYWPESLAYPYGSENGRVVAAVGRCQSLRIAVVEGKHPLVSQTWATRFLIQRIHVSSVTTPAGLVKELGG
jgi:peptidoglycan/xylan/chitin deacetylase (PgdA/CDA1 family)